jgi:hypothetical protein
MIKATLIAALLAAAGATAASAQDWRAQAPYGHGGNGYGGGYPGSDGGLGRYCPPGYYPHSWPNGSGIRCEPPDDGQTFVPSE